MHIVDAAVQLEINGIVHDNLKDLVDVDGRLKFFYDIPSPYVDYSTQRKNIVSQCRQICRCADKIMGEDRFNDMAYKFLVSIFSNVRQCIF